MYVADQLAVVGGLRLDSGHTVEKDIGHAVPRLVVPYLRLDLRSWPLTVDSGYIAQDCYPLGPHLVDYSLEMRIRLVACPYPRDIQDDIAGRRFAVSSLRPDR